jgi:hypothetical protein
MPAKLEPSLTSTKASVFCFRTVRTHPLTETVSSEGTASAVLTRFINETPDAVGVSVLLLLMASRDTKGRFIRVAVDDVDGAII